MSIASGIFAVFSVVVLFLDIRTDATLEGSSMGNLGLPYTQQPVVYPHIIRVSEVKAAHKVNATVSRRKRNILFPSGVKLCAQETAPQVVANHLSYFHLRVCQETVWEAFKIFWDRLPEQGEYQSWMSQCQEGTVTAKEIGSYFSQSDEHQALVKKLDNDIAFEPPTPTVLEQVVELSILLTGEMYTDDLSDPASLKYQTLSRQLAEKIAEALEGLPGFKSVSVIEFRPQKDAQGLDGVVVDYGVTVEVDGTGVSTDQLDYLTLQANLVESSYREIKELPTVVYTISEVKNVLTEALHNDELQSVSEIPEPVNTADGATASAVDEPPEILTLEEDVEDDVLLETSETNTAATTENDVIILEESEVVSPPLVVTTNAPEAGSIEEEGLLLEDNVQSPTVEITTPEEVPAELPLPEQPVIVTLPEPPVEIEASGLSTEDMENLLEPSTEASEEETVSHEDSASEEVETEDIGINTEAASEAEAENIDVAAVEVEATTAAVEEEHPEEVVVNEELAEELEISTISTETTEEEEDEGLPALVPPPEVSEASEPETAEVGLLPAGDGTPEESNLTEVPPAENEVNTNQPEEATDMNVVLTHPEDTLFMEEGVDESEEQEVKEELAPEAPVVEEEAPEAPEILAEDLTEDEMLLVNEGEPVTESLSPPEPTALSPEKESPFTQISDVNPTEGEPEIIIPSLVEIHTTNDGLDGTTGVDLMINFGYGLTNHTEEGSTGFPFGVGHGTDQASIAMPVNPGRALMVFFSLRVTNMIFSDDLFNKSSPEYKALEQRFLDLLVPYLQSNLSHFENLEILNFRNGSIVVNSRMKFGRPVAQGVATTVYLILEDFCNTAYHTMNLAIDKYSLDVESGDQADPCKFQACNEYAECKVNKWTGEAECVCNAGYFSVDGLPCQSICEIQTDFCLNDGKCDIIPGQGAICRCRVGENWWYRGEHCEEYVSEPLVVGIAIASVAGFLLVASGVIFFLARTLRDQYDKDESEDPIRRAESLPSLERATKYNPMFESEATTGYSHYYRRYPEAPAYSSASAEASTDFSSEEIRHIYENSELTKEEIQDRIRIIELYAKDRQFADLLRQHQAILDTRRESSSAQT
ncbi:interphotoreceptor matrix proteoglycan 2 [Parambassis ranga]|uniref:Interphotoreceptor matrix proteoglycan 2 n=1 Tax=Parambassis ranga TaxID=210632 RepID=A0A6P7HNT2_9TELE|nr:interphotoreceptor matrix proteoglycan 2 [Parambassis ranga]